MCHSPLVVDRLAAETAVGNIVNGKVDVIQIESGVDHRVTPEQSDLNCVLAMTVKEFGRQYLPRRWLASWASRWSVRPSSQSICPDSE